MSFRRNALIFTLTIFLIDQDSPVNENFPDPGDLLDSLEEWLGYPAFGSAHISIGEEF
jgi:hypothetical protein